MPKNIAIMIQNEKYVFYIFYLPFFIATGSRVHVKISRIALHRLLFMANLKEKIQLLIKQI